MIRWAWVTLPAAAAAVLLAPTAGAAPQCTTTAPNTTQCHTNGSSQIVTSPSITTNPTWASWPWGGAIVISLGGK